jgi:signal transduction histidine kinase/ActR/RegA family two-component response regulator
MRLSSPVGSPLSDSPLSNSPLSDSSLSDLPQSRSLCQLIETVGQIGVSWAELSPIDQGRTQLWLETSLNQLRSTIDQQLPLTPKSRADDELDSLEPLLIHFIEQVSQFLPEISLAIAQPLEPLPVDQPRWPIGDAENPLAWLVAQAGLVTTLGWTQELQQRFLQRSATQFGMALRATQLLQQAQQQTINLAQKNRELAQVSKLKSEFLANTSHEIRTPLSSILGFTHLLREKGFSPDNLRHQEYLRIILTSGQHLLALINDILDLSKIEANQMDLQWEQIELQPLCKIALMLVKEKANDKGITLKLEIAADCDRLDADPLRLKQMLFNLLSNALKFTDQGQVGLKVTAADQFLRFTVWDTGVGIPPDQQALLFRAYKQLPQTETTRSEGTGLGLALTQKLAELHGGWIEVTSTLGEGSAFTVVLPIAPATAILPPSLTTTAPIVQTTVPTVVAVPGHSAPAAAPAPLPLAKRFRKATRSYHVLLVEDNPHNARLVITFLCKLGYEVTWAKDSEAMWRSLQQSLPAIILMDINLSDISGLTLTQELRQHDRYRDLPIIAQTAMAMSGDKELCLEAGVNDYITKPIDLHHLSEVLARYSDPAAAR